MDKISYNQAIILAGSIARFPSEEIEIVEKWIKYNFINQKTIPVLESEEI